MFLKSIAIQGFKSFANRTSFRFKPGVTAFVGPNGCGKSNVVDAIRWVLGETNARSLRGEIMEDVIFSGSAELKPLGMAEVGITIVNDDALLPIEYSEVNIKRRLFRSGESEFLINKNPVRMKDIQELFADTGIGKASYSVMEQGNVDVILSNRPEERMRIFEEASGITRYKLRIKESYKKLTAAEENLNRLALVISEVEKEYRHLEKQAQKARTYKDLKSREVEYETLFHYQRVQGFRDKVDKNRVTLERLEEKRKSLISTVNRLEKTIKDDMEKVKSRENRIVEVRSKIFKKEAELEATDSKSAHIKERTNEMESEISRRIDLLEKLQKGREELNERIKTLNSEKENIHTLINSQKEKHNTYIKETEHIDNTLADGSEKLLNITLQIDKIEKSLKRSREELKAVIDGLLKEIDDVKSRSRANENKKTKLVQNLNVDIGKIENTLKLHRSKLNDLLYSAGRKISHDLIERLSEEIDGVCKKLGRLKENLYTIMEIQDELSRVIFGEKSLHTKKEQIEEGIAILLKSEENLKKEIDAINKLLKKNGERKEQFKALINNLNTDIAKNTEKLNYYSEDLNRIEGELTRNEESIEDVDFDIKKLKERKQSLETELGNLAKKRVKIEDEKKKLSEEIKDTNQLIERTVEYIQKRESQVAERNHQIEKINRSIEQAELNNAELVSKIETIIESFSESYGISLELYKPKKGISFDSIKEKRDSIKEEISSLGQVNLMAIEEFNEVKQRYMYLTTQRDDLMKAREDINSLISETIQHSNEVFRSCFEKIRQNFQSIFSRLFNGGSTDLYLTNERDIFSSGVEIMACPPGKSLRRRSLLSGGEKGLTAVALLFAIFMVRPSPFCILDEVDHDLDEENILRFIKLLKEFTDTTQFIIITHNRRTIEFADVIYGITAEQVGVSKVVSLDMVEQVIE
ncbi:MAG: AAA family ATPase [Spirochaetota bacterium]|nr:MAG: AAA family ATPase [Spirochaetota bacterium]